MPDRAPYKLVRDEQGVIKPPLGKPGSQGGVFLGRSNADPSAKEVAIKILFVDEKSSAETEAVLRPSALRMRRRNLRNSDSPTSSSLVRAAFARALETRASVRLGEV